MGVWATRELKNCPFEWSALRLATSFVTDRAALLHGRLAEPAGPLPVVVASRVRRHRLGVAAEDLPQPDGRQPAERERLDARTEGDRRLGP
jgi:hypothetical protein